MWFALVWRRLVVSTRRVSTRYRPPDVKAIGIGIEYINVSSLVHLGKEESPLT